jgi:8-oxo-dGTP pyrophosphatase MutT (NUDIX family)
VPQRKRLIDAIRRELAAHRPHRIEPAGRPRAAVLILLYSKEGEEHVLFTLRTERVAHHKGQISFPGGAADADDAGLRVTALRETFEEVGVRPENVEILGEMDEMPAISGFVVTPFVGVVTSSAPIVFEGHPQEVEEILEVPLRHLMDKANTYQELRQVGGREVLTDCYRFGEHVIWGLTARMLTEFLDLVAAATASEGEARPDPPD